MLIYNKLAYTLHSNKSKISKLEAKLQQEIADRHASENAIMKVVVEHKTAIDIIVKNCTQLSREVGLLVDLNKITIDELNKVKAEVNNIISLRRNEEEEEERVMEINEMKEEKGTERKYGGKYGY